MIRTKKIMYVIVLIVKINNTDKLIAQKNIYLSVGSYRELEFNRYLTTVSLGFLYNSDKKVLVGAEICKFKFWQTGYSSYGIGLSPIVQICIIKKNMHKLYLESKGGIMYMFPEYPETAVNYSLLLGTCYEIHLLEKHKLRFGFAYRHSSNGKIKEQPTNQMWDGIGINSGWIFN